jgi:hypothetical protein
MKVDVSRKQYSSEKYSDVTAEGRIHENATDSNCKITGIGVGVGVRLAADSQSTSSSWYRAPLWGPLPDFILVLSLVTIACFHVL